MADFAHTITLEQDGFVARLTFSSDHPANVFTLPMLEEMAKHVDSLNPASTRVLVIEGKPTIFSGGADLQSILDMDAATYRAYVETEYALFRAIETLPFVSLAILHGSCVGNAAEIALACDLRIAADDVRIGWPEVHVGFVAPAQRLARFVGIGTAKEILFTGRLLKADQARAFGLLTSVVPAAEVDTAAAKVIEQMAGRAPVSVRVTKGALERAYSFPPENPGLEVEAAAESYDTLDFREGATSILERRAPIFQGR